MRIIFRNKELQNLAKGIGDHHYPTGIGKKYRFVLQQLAKMNSLHEARQYTGWSAEWKQGDRADQFGIRLNGGRRMMLKQNKEDLEVLLVREVVDYH